MLRRHLFPALFFIATLVFGCSAKDAGGEDAGADACVPDCDGMDCGDDGCGGSCGECSFDMVCDESTGLCVTEAEVMVPMEDGVRLATKIYLPDGDGPFPALIERTPYHAGAFAGYFDYVAPSWTGRGYAYIGQDCRGTGGSEGAWRPYQDDVIDGGYLADWVAEQPWTNGRIGTVGCSYTGFTALATAAGSGVIDAVLSDGPAESEAVMLAGGTLSTNTLSWMNLVATGEWFSLDAAQTATNSLDPSALDELLLGYVSPLWQAMVSDSSPQSAFWEDYGLAGDYPNICTPALIVDNGETSAHPVWTHLLTSGCAEMQPAHRVIIAPGGHCHYSGDIQTGTESGATGDILGFMAYYLKDAPSELVSSDSRFHYRAQGDSDENLDVADVFPPTSSQQMAFYLHESEGLDQMSPAADEQPAIFVVDPSNDDPCTDYVDAAMYESDPLSEDLLIVGLPRAVLWVSASGADADYFVYLATDSGDMLLWSHARARYRGGYDEPESIVAGQPFELSIPPTASVVQRVPAGSRLIVYIAGAAYEYSENPHTGEPLVEQSHWEVSEHRILHGPEHPSRVILHVLSPQE